MKTALAQRKPFEIEYRFRAADGSEKWLWDRGCGVYNETGKLVAIEGFVTDTTELGASRSTRCARARHASGSSRRTCARSSGSPTR